MNKVVLIGRTTKEIELRTAGDKSVANFTLAVDRPVKQADGSKQADFINCVAWAQKAETLAQYVKKGHRLGVSGRIQARTYDDKEGRTQYAVEVVVEDFEFLQPKDDAKPEPKAEPKADPKPAATFDDEFVPF